MKYRRYLFWVGCAGAYDARAKKVKQSFFAGDESGGVRFAILGDDENVRVIRPSCRK